MWPVVYRIPATNAYAYRHRMIRDPVSNLPIITQMSRDNPLLWCDGCEGQAYEDLFHCIWICEVSQNIWCWATPWLLKSQGCNRNFILSSAQALLGAYFPPECGLKPIRLWPVLRAVVIFQIWKGRNDITMEGMRVSVSAIISKIWCRMLIYIQSDWSGLVKRIRCGNISLEMAWRKFVSWYGTGSGLTLREDLTLSVPVFPP